MTKTREQALDELTNSYFKDFSQWLTEETREKAVSEVRKFIDEHNDNHELMCEYAEHVNYDICDIIN